MIDRIGSDTTGKYFSPLGSSFESRSLPPFMKNQPYTEYKVMKSFNIYSGKVAPWFDQPGGGTQYFTDFMIKDRYGNLVNADVENLLKWNYIIPKR